MSKEIHVITVATNVNQGYLNFIESLRINNYDSNNISILGQKQKFGGWKWRTEQYLNRIREINDKDALYVCCDSSDLFFIEGPDVLQEHFEKYASPVVISIQSNYYNISVDNASKCYENCITEPFCYPNCGFVMGTFDGMIEYYNRINGYDDDEYGTADIYEPDSNLFIFDVNLSLCCNMSAFSLNSMRYWKVNENEMKSEITGNKVCALHFSGKLSEPLYNDYIRIFYPDMKLRSVESMSKLMKTIIFCSLLLLILFICFRLLK